MSKKSKKQIVVLTKEKFIESVYHIVFFGDIIRNTNDTCLAIKDKITNDEMEIVRLTMQWNVMIITISLLDEIEKYLLSYQDLLDDDLMERIKAYKFMIEPILSEINKWSDLRKFRNNVLAHNFRIDSEGFKSVHLANRLHTYNVPQSTMDFFVLLKYLDTIIRPVKEIFEVEYQEALKKVNSFDIPSRQLQSIDTEIDKVNAMVCEVNSRISKYNFS